MRRCHRCGCYLSAHAFATDKFCWPCHPKVEGAYQRVCSKGHDLTIHGAATLSGAGRTTTRCMTCKRERDRLRAAHRRATRDKGEA